MIKKYIELLIFTFLFSVSIFIYIDFNIGKENIDNEKSINIIFNNEHVSIPLGSTFKDLLISNNYDIENNYSISLDYVLKDNEVINLLDNNNSSNKISINNANLSDLTTLPGIGEKTANKIIEYREKYGNFKHIEELKNVSGIGDKKYEKIKELITI